MIKGSIHQENITILNAYALNNSFKIHEANTNFTQSFQKLRHKGVILVMVT